MKLVAYAGPEAGRRDWASYVLQLGKVRFMLTTALRPDSFIAQHVAQHGDGVCSIALELDPAESGRHWRKKEPQAIGKSRGGWNTKVHRVAADARTAIAFALSPGNAHDTPEGRELLRELPRIPEGLPMLMDRAYEGDETRQLVLDLGMAPVVPPKSNRIEP